VGSVPLFTRRPAFPATIRERLTLPPGDRMLAVTELEGDRWAGASRRALYLTDPDGNAERHPWSDIDRARLAPDTATLTVNWVDGRADDLALIGAGAPSFARTLRERVQSSVVHSEIVTLPGGGQARVALRRGEDGRLLSQVIGSPDLDLGDPDVAARVDAAESRVRSAAGLAG
jgi:hypothetical protein